MSFTSDNVTFSKEALIDLSEWVCEDRKKYQRIINLIEDILRNGLNQGLGKPEKLRYQNEARYSRRIDEKNRIVYTERDGSLYVISCKGHYNE